MKRLLIFSLILLMLSVLGVWFFRSKAIIKAQTVNPTPIPSYDSSEWFMAGANPQRTSHVDSTSTNQTEIPGKLYPQWYIPLEPYMPYGWQLVVGNDTIYISTSNGVYAFDKDAGVLYNQNPSNPQKPWLKWVFPTELPVGQSPTVITDQSTGQSTLYVGGFDKKIYAIDANPDINTLQTDSALGIDSTGQRINNKIKWSFDAQKYWNEQEPQALHIAAGFNTNPLVINGKLYAGNRDGYMYALNATTGALLWQFKTGGPVLYSAAVNAAGDTIFFASDDSYAYALAANDGSLVWKSQKLPGSGFHNWWPVIYRDKVVYSGSHNFRFGIDNPGMKQSFATEENTDVYPDKDSDPPGTPVQPEGFEPGDWAVGTVTINASRILEYFEEPTSSEEVSDPGGYGRDVHKPWRRTFFVLNSSNGMEYTFDSDGDGQPEYAPILWTGTHGGNRYPPVVSSDDVLYQQNGYRSGPYIGSGTISGWQLGTPFISVPTLDHMAVDELHAFSAGGNIIYWVNCCDREFGSFDVTIPIGGSNREWMHFSYHQLESLIPGYNDAYQGSDHEKEANFETFGGLNGIYGKVGNNSPPIPYSGRVYMLKGNSLIAFHTGAGSAVELPMAHSIPVQDVRLNLSTDYLTIRLAEEIQKMIDAGHLRPGYLSNGIVDPVLNKLDLLDYWHHPFDTIYTLTRALPHLPEDLQTEIVAYLESEFNSYPPYQYNHIGWKSGSPREAFTLPPEVEVDRPTSAPRQEIYNYVWKVNPQSFYAIWKYAEALGLTQTEALALFKVATGNNGKRLMESLENVPSDDVLIEMPYVNNAYIAGYLGYVKLAELAGFTMADMQSRQATLDHMLSVRASSFSKDTQYGLNVSDYNTKRRRVLNASQNFMYMVPELAEYLHDNIPNKVQEAVDEYNTIAPYWFVSRFEDTYNEGAIELLYDYNALFQARALVLQQPREQLLKYLDVPAVERGDLFYIDNLVSLLEAPSTGITVSPTPNGSGSPTPTSTPSTPGDTDGDNDVDIFDYNAVITDFGKTGGQGFSAADFDTDGDVDIFDYNVVISNFGR